MEFHWSTVAWIAGLVFVYIFGLFEGRGQGYKKRKAEEAQEKQDQPPPASTTSTTPVRIVVDDPGLLRIKNENGSFALDLDGTRVNPIALSPEQRKRLIEMLNIMRPWLEGKPVSAPSMTSQQPPRASQAVPPVLTQTQAATVQPEISPPPRPQPTTPKPATIAKEDRPAAPANSIITQIDSILQARLAGTPLEERGIFLTQSPEGGVMVYVGLTPYHGVDEVPDAEIKAAIRAAISEWEDKYTPGLQR